MGRPGRPRKPPTTVVRLPVALVAYIDELRGDKTRAEFLADRLVRQVGPPPRGVSPSLERFRRLP